MNPIRGNAPVAGGSGTNGNGDNSNNNGQPGNVNNGRGAPGQASSASSPPVPTPITGGPMQAADSVITNSGGATGGANSGATTQGGKTKTSWWQKIVHKRDRDYPRTEKEEKQQLKKALKESAAEHARQQEQGRFLTQDLRAALFLSQVEQSGGAGGATGGFDIDPDDSSSSESDSDSLSDHLPQDARSQPPTSPTDIVVPPTGYDHNQLQQLALDLTQQGRITEAMAVLEQLIESKATSTAQPQQPQQPQQSGGADTGQPWGTPERRHRCSRNPDSWRRPTSPVTKNHILVRPRPTRSWQAATCSAGPTRGPNWWTGRCWWIRGCGWIGRRWWIRRRWRTRR